MRWELLARRNANYPPTSGQDENFPEELLEGLASQRLKTLLLGHPAVTVGEQAKSACLCILYSLYFAQKQAQLSCHFSHVSSSASQSAGWRGHVNEVARGWGG